jgi:hypothetical protein
MAHNFRVYVNPSNGTECLSVCSACGDMRGIDPERDCPHAVNDIRGIEVSNLNVFRLSTGFTLRT